MSKIDNDTGLTAVELLVTIVVSGIIASAAINLHINQQRIFVREEALTNMRNNVRRALDIITRDLRMAGYNPKEASDFDLAVRDARADRIWIVMDLDENGCWTIPDSLGEQRGFHFIGDSALYRINFIDSVNVVNRLIANNIDYLEFKYIDANGDTIARPVAGANLQNIRAVNVTIVGITEREFSNHREEGTYPDGTTYNDRHYRYWLTRTIELRNH